MKKEEKLIPFCDQCYGSKYVKVYNVATGQIKTRTCPKCDGKGIFYEPPRKKPKGIPDWCWGWSIYDHYD